MAVDLETLRSIALSLPGMIEGSAYGTTAYRRGKSFVGRLRDQDCVLVLRINIDERDMLIQAQPSIFFPDRTLPRLSVCPHPPGMLRAGATAAPVRAGLAGRGAGQGQAQARPAGRRRLETAHSSG